MSEEENGDQDVILFMFFGLFIGAVTNFMLSHWMKEFLPYTVVVFIEGIIFAELQKHSDMGILDGSITRWANIDGELILYVFLPALIFGEAMNLNWYQVKGGFTPAALLAGPGVVIGAFVMGTICYFIMPFDWTWNTSMLFGSILSATDPVAVVSLLKGAGASSKLTILIIGESLMNDGTAMVLFTLFYNLLEGKSYDFAEIVEFFTAMTIGSCVLGAALGILAVRFLRVLNRPLMPEDTVLQISVTFCTAYLSFYIAQSYVEISGVLSCSTAGVILAWMAPPIILNHESMHNVWAFVEWVGNTMIFLLAGLIFGSRTLESVETVDWLYLFALYIFIHLVRVLVVGVFYPIFSRTNVCSFQDAIFIVWGGLRGALGIVLGLIVEVNSSKLGIDHEDAKKLFFFVGGLATLTLVINATTANKLLAYLGLVGFESSDKTLVLRRLRKRLRNKMTKLVDNLAKTYSLDASALEGLKENCSVFDINREDSSNQGSSRISESDMLFEASRNERFADLRNLIRSISGVARRDRVSEGARKSSDHRDDQKSPVRAITRSYSYVIEFVHEDLMAYIRTIFLQIVRVRYWHHISEGKLPRLSFSAQSLLYSIDVGLDNVYRPYSPAHDQFTDDWLYVQETISNDEKTLLRMLGFLDRLVPQCLNFGTFRYNYGWASARRDKRSVYMLMSFIEAHEHAQKKVHEFVGELEPTEESIGIPEENYVIAESVASVEMAKKLLSEIDTEQVSLIVRQQISRTVLAKQTQFVNDMVSEGLLTSKDAEAFYSEISEDVKKCDKIRNEANREQSKKAADLLRSTLTVDPNLSLSARLLDGDASYIYN